MIKCVKLKLDKVCQMNFCENMTFYETAFLQNLYRKCPAFGHEKKKRFSVCLRTIPKPFKVCPFPLWFHTLSPFIAGSNSGSHLLKWCTIEPSDCVVCPHGSQNKIISAVSSSSGTTRNHKEPCQESRELGKSAECCAWSEKSGLSELNDVKYGHD